MHLDKCFSHKFFYSSTPLLTLPGAFTNSHTKVLAQIPFCQLSAPDHVTIKDAALQLNTASKSQGKESWEKHLFLSSMRDHVSEEEEGVETDRVRHREQGRERERASLCTLYWHCV